MELTAEERLLRAILGEPRPLPKCDKCEKPMEHPIGYNGGTYHAECLGELLEY